MGQGLVAVLFPFFFTGSPIVKKKRDELDTGDRQRVMGVCADGAEKEPAQTAHGRCGRRRRAPRGAGLRRRPRPSRRRTQTTHGDHWTLHTLLECALGVESANPGLLERLLGPPGDHLLTPHSVEAQALRVQLDMGPDDIPLPSWEPVEFAKAREAADRAVDYLVEVAGADPSVLVGALPTMPIVGTVPVLAGPLTIGLARDQGLCPRGQEAYHLVVSWLKDFGGAKPEFAALWPSPTSEDMAWLDIEKGSFRASSVTLTKPLAALARLAGPYPQRGVTAVKDAVVRLLVSAARDAAGPRGEAWYGLRPVAFADLPRDIGHAIGYIISPPGQPLLRATSVRTFYEARLDPCDLLVYIMQTMDGGIVDRAANLLYPEDTPMKRAASTFAREGPQFAFDRAPESLWPLIAAYRAQNLCNSDTKDWDSLADAARALDLQVSPPVINPATGQAAAGAYPNWRAACGDVRTKIVQRLEQSQIH